MANRVCGAGTRRNSLAAGSSASVGAGQRQDNASAARDASAERGGVSRPWEGSTANRGTPRAAASRACEKWDSWLHAAGDTPANSEACGVAVTRRRTPGVRRSARSASSIAASIRVRSWYRGPAPRFSARFGVQSALGQATCMPECGSGAGRRQRRCQSQRGLCDGVSAGSRVAQRQDQRTAVRRATRTSAGGTRKNHSGECNVRAGAESRPTQRPARRRCYMRNACPRNPIASLAAARASKSTGHGSVRNDANANVVEPQRSVRRQRCARRKRQQVNGDRGARWRLAASNRQRGTIRLQVTVEGDPPSRPIESRGAADRRKRRTSTADRPGRPEVDGRSRRQRRQHLGRSSSARPL